jgi:hypothetical protein
MTKIIAVAALASLVSFACTTTTTISAPPAASSPDAGPADDTDGGATAEGVADAGSDAAHLGDGPIGTRSDKGIATVHVNISTHASYDCADTCTAAGGSCKEGGANGVGWVDTKSNDGSGDTFGYQISSCSESESYASGNSTITSMDCTCNDMPAPPTIRVRKSEGLFACAKVCASWSLTCSSKRTSYSFGDEVESTSTPIDCTMVPAATSHHYTCACDP